jgi:hypothetical protein
MAFPCETWGVFQARHFGAKQRRLFFPLPLDRRQTVCSFSPDSDPHGSIDSDIPTIEISHLGAGLCRLTAGQAGQKNLTWPKSFVRDEGAAQKASWGHFRDMNRLASGSIPPDPQTLQCSCISDFGTCRLGRSDCASWPLKGIAARFSTAGDFDPVVLQCTINKSDKVGPRERQRIAIAWLQCGLKDVLLSYSVAYWHISELERDGDYTTESQGQLQLSDWTSTATTLLQGSAISALPRQLGAK